MAKLARPDGGPMAPLPTDQDDLSAILARAIEGDNLAWRRLIDLYAKRVYALARSRLRRDDLAEEITQSVFATIAMKLSRDGYREQGRFEAWLFRVTMNRVRDEARRSGRHAAPADPAELDRSAAAIAPEDPVRDELPALRAAIASLSEADREVIELRHHAQMSFKAIAQYLDEPLGTVLARHHRALAKLRELMNPPEPSEAQPKARGTIS